LIKDSIMEHDIINDFEIALLRCPECADEMKLSIYKNESIRNTYCTNCEKAVYWTRVEKPTDKGE